MKITEETMIKMFINFIIIVLYFMAVYSLISFIFFPKESMLWYDYIIEIIAYFLLGTVLFYKRKLIIERLTH